MTSKIPDEAVEAAARRIASHYGAGANNWEWYLPEARPDSSADRGVGHGRTRRSRRPPSTRRTRNQGVPVKTMVQVLTEAYFNKFYPQPMTIPESRARAAGVRELAVYLAANLEAAGYGPVKAATVLIRDLTDPDDCSFDHHGGCQAHGYLDLEIGEMCPQLEAKAWAYNHAAALESDQ